MYSLEEISTTTIVKRPSVSCKTPYVADITINDNAYLAHTPALGCCGLSDNGCKVIVSKINGEKNKCKYRVDLAVLYERGRDIIVGINPKLAETLMYKCLIDDRLPFLKGLTDIRREVQYTNSRFDFVGKDASNKTFIMEVKNVPLADYVDVSKKERKKYKGIERKMCYDEKIAYFPDGYRKNNVDIVSPRALKHVEELEEIVKTTDARAILCFVIQRTDVSHFQPSNIDKTYKAAVQKAWKNGVEIKAIQFSWSLDGTCSFVRDNLPVVLFDIYGPYQ